MNNFCCFTGVEGECHDVKSIFLINSHHTNRTNTTEHHQPINVNSEIDIKVKALSVILNHSNYEVAHASVKQFLSRMSLKNGNFAINGTLGKFLVLDLTSQGSLYRDRFLSTHGHDTMLFFDFFKYGDPEQAAKEQYDATLKIRMASVIYVHTQRFYSELLAFFRDELTSSKDFCLSRRFCISKKFDCIIHFVYRVANSIYIFFKAFLGIIYTSNTAMHFPYFQNTYTILKSVSTNKVLRPL